MKHMSGTGTLSISLILLLGGGCGRLEAQRSPDPNSPRYQGVVALQELIQGEGKDSLLEFIRERIAPAMLESMGEEALIAKLEDLRKRFAHLEARGARPVGPFAAKIVFNREGGQEEVSFRLSESSPHQFVEIDASPLQSSAKPDTNHGPAPVVTISSRDDLISALQERLRREAERGFSGAILVARGDDTLVAEGYGKANREKGIPNTPETLFDVGSLAKLLTRVAIFKLEEMGRLGISDPISKFFPQAPRDKRQITIEQLLWMKSGLGEYHDLTGDFEPLTRSQALERIFVQRLRFVPGGGEAYSNSGYALLAAIVEEASGMSYPSFVDHYLLRPAGLKETGFYRLRDWDPDSVAVGYEAMNFGEVNSPAYWPEVSWACLGGGCLVSSSRELFRWYRALAGGKVLSAGALSGAVPQVHGLMASAGGNDFGFGAVVVEERIREDLVILVPKQVHQC